MCSIHGICILAPGDNVSANMIFHPVLRVQETCKGGKLLNILMSYIIRKRSTAKWPSLKTGKMIGRREFKTVHEKKGNKFETIQYNFTC